ncbi:MAG: radical SAM family heme chaperone HemW [Zetaproteobacteria bacterium]|nr:radical SAM family heme chaperone HemW [Zetaproteobacteria bacterium]
MKSRFCKDVNEKAPLQLYIHIPFCLHRCHYCDFNAHVREAPPWDAYALALTRELHAWSQHEAYAHRPIHTIFFGGGTPSLAPPTLIANIINQAQQCFGFTADIEITLESNPGAIDHTHIADYAAAGVNRLSIGAQSFNDHELQWMERVHTHNKTLEMINAAQQHGIARLNLDLIYGLPKQTIKAWLTTLKQAIEIDPGHLSCYQLTIEPHTKLAKQHAIAPYPMPNEALSLEFMQQTRAELQQQGYLAYEVSNFAKKGANCRHNDGYWRYHDYIGIGAGAAGKWDAPLSEGGGIYRYSNIRSPEGYIKSILEHHLPHAINSDEHLNRIQAAGEAMWLGLRRSEGVDLAAFKQRFDAPPHQWFQQAITSWRERGTLIESPTHLLLSQQGVALADLVAEDFLTLGD